VWRLGGERGAGGVSQKGLLYEVGADLWGRDGERRSAYGKGRVEGGRGGVMQGLKYAVVADLKGGRGEQRDAPRGGGGGGGGAEGVSVKAV
jgi:hypothetical protein